MALDPYASCPCGSGKKFKWCCQPIHVQIDRAFQQDSQGQHEVALRLMDEVIAEHAANPEAWGRKAQLLYQNGKVEDAEAALQKAFEISPKYAFGYLLRGMFRYQEGEVPGGLLLFRKAADYYDPEAHDLIAQVYGFIADCEMRLNRPVAARAALRIVLRNQPSDVETRESFEGIFGPKGRLPAAARKEYAFLSPAPSVSRRPPRRLGPRPGRDGAAPAWATPPAPSTSCPGPTRTTRPPPTTSGWPAPGWARTAPPWKCSTATSRLETDEEKAGEAWALAEVLRCGYGMDEQSDYHEYSVAYQLRDAQPVQAMLEDWEPRPPADPAQHRRAGERLQRSGPGTRRRRSPPRPAPSEGGPLAGLPAHRRGRRPAVGSSARALRAGPGRVRAEGPRRACRRGTSASAGPRSATW